VLCEARSHIVDRELSMIAWFSGCLARTILSEDGILSWPTVERSLRMQGPSPSPTSLIVLENTHNAAGGTVYPIDLIDEICNRAHDRGVKVHMDGARVFNAAAALNIPVSRIVRAVDSVMFCLSKGLGAPVGSLLAGSRRDIERARLYRKALGGGMRQAGLLAAAGAIALEQGPGGLSEDHAKAKVLAERIMHFPGITIKPFPVQTNIVILDLAKLGCEASQFNLELKKRNVLANQINSHEIRLVTHRDVTHQECELAAEAIVQTVSSLASGPE
jgi:threonine aldolase